MCVCVCVAHKPEGVSIWKINVLRTTWVLIGMNLKEKALEWKSQAPWRREYNKFSLKKKKCHEFHVEQMPFWTRQDQTTFEGLPVWLPHLLEGLEGGRPQSALLCVSVETTKTTKRRSYSFFVSFSWEQQVEAALWFSFFTMGAINRLVRVAFWLSYLQLPAPHHPGGSDSHMSSRRSQPPHLHFPQHVCDKKKRRNGAGERVLLLFLF